MATAPLTTDAVQANVASPRPGWHPRQWGVRISAGAALALGVIGLLRGDFTIVWHPVPDTLYARPLLAYAAAVLFILAGLGLQRRRAAVPAGALLCALYLLLSLGWLRRVILLPGVIGTWLGFSEQIALAIGAAAIVLQARGHVERGAVACRIAFGVCQLVFGLGHFLSLPETVAMTPGWLPPGPTFWALATGAAHAAGGALLIVGFRPVATTRALAVMFAAFGLLVWLPRLALDASAAVPWAGNAINLALIGAVLALGDLLAARPGETANEVAGTGAAPPATTPMQGPAPIGATHRLASIDLLRGIAMILMALDHVRDLLHEGAMVALPTDLQSTTVPLFATRWITHFCAPAFALTAGLGAWLWWQRGRSRAELSRYLATRGLWLMALEITVMQLAYYFSWSAATPLLLLVLWSLGLSMVVLAGLVWLPSRVLGVFAAATILLHPLLDGITADRFGVAAGLWNIVHQVGAFQIGSRTVVTPYPIIPWVAVMALGFAIGPLVRFEAGRRRRCLLAMGGAALAGFMAMRLINFYGDPAPWSRQDSPVFTLLSFLNTTKYPASPAFLLMTLGVTLIGLACCDRLSVRGGSWRIATVFGRVPLFYYVVHFYAAHLIATALAFATYGRAAWEFIFLPYPSFGGPADRFPQGFGYDLWAVYLVWLALLASLYPLCRWYSGVRSRRSHRWLSYV